MARTKLASFTANFASLQSRYRRLPDFSHLAQLRLDLRILGGVCFLAAYNPVVESFFTADLLVQVGYVPNLGSKKPDT